MSKDKIFIVDYACGFHPFVCEVDYTCALRCQAGLRAFKKNPEAKFILGAGMKNITQGCGSLSDMMKNFLMEHGVDESLIFMNPRGHNTLTETEAAYSLIMKQGGGKIICATSSYHSARVWCIWFFRFGITPEMYTSKLKLNKRSFLKECLKVPLDSIRAFGNRFYIISK